MSNIEAARKALQAELSHAKLGHAHYAAQVASLQQALAQISSLGVEVGNGLAADPSAKAKRGRPRKEQSAHELPSTRGDFWSKHVGQAPQFAPDILAAAIAGLGFEPTSAQRKVLSNRLGPALSALVKSGKVADSGKGRLRRYFKP